MEHDAYAETVEEPSEYEAKLEEIEARAAASDLKTERHTREDGSVVLTVHFGDARGDRSIVGNYERAEALLAIPFEDYRTVPGYEAIYSRSRDEIEARLRTSGPVFWPYRKRHPFDKPHKMASSPGSGDHELELTTVSTTFRAINPSRRMARGLESAPALRLRGFNSTDPEQARRVLDEFGPTILFELDIVYDVPMEIAKSQILPRQSQRDWAISTAPPEFPANSYDSEPVALYMYGRSARGMPLLEYLAYYQSIEFYFPRYAAAEVRRRVEKIIKDPRFNPHMDRDIGRLVEVVQGRGGRTHGSELEQLKATIHSCLEQEEIKEFIQANEEREQFLRDRRSTLTPHTLVLANRNIDLRDAVATRVYDLRCRIVHTKDEPNEGEPERLLPNSPEAQLLDYDIELLRLLAARVIVASSREIAL